MDYLATFGQWCGGPGFFQGGPGGGWGSWLPFHMGGIFQLLIIGLIIYFVARLFRNRTGTTAAEGPHDILKRRYAAGEIDSETYERMRDELG